MWDYNQFPNRGFISLLEIQWWEITLTEWALGHNFEGSLLAGVRCEDFTGPGACDGVSWDKKFIKVTRIILHFESMSINMQI
jgi:hypothetical protein